MVGKGERCSGRAMAGNQARSRKRNARTRRRRNYSLEQAGRSKAGVPTATARCAPAPGCRFAGPRRQANGYDERGLRVLRFLFPR